MQTSTTPRFSRSAIAIAVGVLLVIGVATVSLTGHAEKSAPAAPAATPVTVASVIERSVTEWDDFSGRVEAIERVEIRPRISGTIDAVHFQDGQLVKKGALLFTIDPRPYKAELARAEAARAGAQARLTLSKTELDRTRRLLEDRAVAQRELDQRENALHEADANLKAADAAVLTARLNLQYTEITAPVSGRVSRAEITVGNLVATGPTAPTLTTLVSVSPVYVNFEVDEPTYIRYAGNGTVGNSGVNRVPVSIGLTSEEGYPRQGHVKSFDNRIDNSSGTIRVRAVFANEDGTLTPGMYARVRTGDSNAKNALLIDDKAVGTDQDKKFVMVVGADNKAVYRPVTLGPMVEGLRVVRSGLKLDERIVVNGLQRIRPNDTVAPEVVKMDARVASANTGKSAGQAASSAVN
ncbi:efflux RND transporter periplasmic adaptor subunit [Herminiimonas fonticola]|uniref:Multidrug efflux system membrane fusion protein n=1 Tax=Herminiimonas fonticola TaxID=303380 RepID=A0A4R6G3T0_9BURK|nr:efflux RND transporter periplasmic adaptor subunit [Herminiimonas fonticola]RBA23481.1 efflux transporter, RND family, MFP subunit [Herminiimonas fonticola]TDN88264.1 multidrug efflux system membrane fusion protein [Herminiimonas fonticola]